VVHGSALVAVPEPATLVKGGRANMMTPLSVINIYKCLS